MGILPRSAYEELGERSVRDPDPKVGGTAFRPTQVLDSSTAGWQLRAACRGEDSSYFFAPSYFEKRWEKDAREAVAKAICTRCPVLVECREYALDVREGHGIWGGLNEMERRMLLRQRAAQAV